MSNILNISSKEVIKQYKPILFIYATMVILSFIIGYYVYSKLNNNLGSSLEINNLIQGFNRTTLIDFFNTEKDFLPSFLSITKWISLLYIFISIFLNAGFLANIFLREYTIRSLTSNAIKFGLKYLMLSLFFTIVFILLTAFIYIPYFLILGNPLTEYRNELTFLYSLFSVSILWIICSVFIITWATLANLQSIIGQPLGQSIKKGFASLWLNKGKFLIWGSFVLLCHIGLFILMLNLNKANSALSWFYTIIVFIAMQFVNITKIWMKGFYFKGIIEIHECE